MPDKKLQIVLDAAARNVSAVLSLPSAGMLRNHKSRFIAEIDGQLLLESPRGEEALIAELIRTQAPCAISFRSGIYKAVYATRIRSAQQAWKLNDHMSVDVIFTDLPNEIKTSQRRSNYRVEIPPDTEISVRVWRLGPTEYFKVQPSATKELKAELRDISTGGIGVRLIGKDGQLPIVCPEDRLRVELKMSNQSIIVEGAMRAPSTPPQNGVILTGIQFKKLEENLEGRQTLAQLLRIVGDLHREELRMTRLGLMKTA